MLRTERLLLREFEDDDWRAVHAFESDPEVVRYLSFDPRSEEESRALNLKRRGYALEDPRVDWELAIVFEGNVIGRCGLGIRGFREGAIWFVLDPHFHKRGFAVEAMRAVVDFGFRELELHRIFGDCDPRNPASARVMERLGMKREAHLRENVFLKGEWCDSVIYGILEDEWRPETSSSHRGA